MSLLREDQKAQILAKRKLMGFFLIIHCWACVGLSMYVAVVSSNVIIILIAMVLIGSRQQALLVLMHEAAHGNLFKNKFLNKWCSQVFCAYPVLGDMKLYQNYHAKHHAWTQTEKDPDLLLTKHYPVSLTSMLRKFARDISGVTGVRQIRDRLVDLLDNPDVSTVDKVNNLWRNIGGGVSINFMCFCVFLVSGLGWAYFWLWLVPLLTWHQVVLRVRNIAEHALLTENSKNVFRQARTTIASGLERILIAPYWVNYHLEHHLFPTAPCYNLPQVRAFLIENGFEKDLETEESYLAVLKRITNNFERHTFGSHGKKRLVGSFSKGYKIKD